MRASGQEIRAALERPESYPNDPEAVEVRETHISWVFLAGDRAYKLKKPVRLDFVDYSSPARRREMCREEVRLNRRLAPDIYLGVCGVRETENGIELVDEDDPRATEFLVEMARYDESDTLAARLERGELERDQVAAVGTVLADFHARARTVRTDTARALALERRFERNLHELLAYLDQRCEVDHLLALQRFAHAFLAARAGLFQTRADSGLVREGHGDLRAEHVVLDAQLDAQHVVLDAQRDAHDVALDGRVRIVDCVEFDPELRELDVADDLSFLVYDLAAHGGERFGDVLVRAYRDAGGDPGDAAPLAFYAVYRALVRAKVALVRAAEQPAGSAAHGQASARARELIGLAERFAWRARVPLAIVVCGVPASGKSHLASALAACSGLPHLSSDFTRKRLAGIRPSQRAPSETYSPEWNARTYAELGRRAAQALANPGGAVIDATFRHLADRKAFASSFADAAPLLFIECQAPPPVLARRAGRRARDPGRVSDADLPVVLREQQAWEPLDEVSAAAHLALRTDRPVEEILADVLALLDRRLGATMTQGEA